MEVAVPGPAVVSAGLWYRLRCSPAFASDSDPGLDLLRLQYLLRKLAALELGSGCLTTESQLETVLRSHEAAISSLDRSFRITVLKVWDALLQLAAMRRRGEKAPGNEHTFSTVSSRPCRFRPPPDFMQSEIGEAEDGSTSAGESLAGAEETNAAERTETRQDVLQPPDFELVFTGDLLRQLKAYLSANTNAKAATYMAMLQKSLGEVVGRLLLEDGGGALMVGTKEDLASLLQRRSVTVTELYEHARETRHKYGSSHRCAAINLLQGYCGLPLEKRRNGGRIRRQKEPGAADLAEEGDCVVSEKGEAVWVKPIDVGVGRRSSKASSPVVPQQPYSRTWDATFSFELQHDASDDGEVHPSTVPLPPMLVMQTDNRKRAGDSGGDEACPSTTARGRDVVVVEDEKASLREMPAVRKRRRVETAKKGDDGYFPV